MFTPHIGRGRISKNPFVRAEVRQRAHAGDTLTRILESEAVDAMLGALVLLFVIDIALGATLALNGLWTPLF